MELDKESQEKLQELQILEHNLQNILMQKQAFQLELNETVNALEEVKKTSSDIYKMVGSIMIKANKEKTLKDLEEKKKVLELRNKSLDNQEKLFHNKVQEIQGFLKTSVEKQHAKEEDKKPQK